jgi:hypothetical protein
MFTPVPDSVSSRLRMSVAFSAGLDGGPIEPGGAGAGAGAGAGIMLFTDAVFVGPSALISDMTEKLGGS